MPPLALAVAPSGPTPAWAWAGFVGLLVLLLAIDLLTHRGGRHSSGVAAASWAVVWIAVGLGFSAFVGWLRGGDAAEAYLGAYLLEKSLSLDNLFVFLVIFRTLQIDKGSQRTVLSWGVFGALLFRLGFVFLGVAALERYHAMVYVFGAILLWTSFRVLRDDPSQKTESPAVKWLTRHLPVTETQQGTAFFLLESGRRVATPLFLALCAVELTDIVFAVDSVPAALSLSQDLFVVYTSNAFAVLGLRSLFLVIERAVGNLRYLHYGLAAVLAFAAVKLIGSRWFELSPLLSLSVILGCLAVSVLASLRARRRSPAGKRGHAPHHPPPRSPVG